MMPEEWGSGVRVSANTVQEMRGILIHAVVDKDSFILLCVRFVSNWGFKWENDLYEIIILTRIAR
jgi:hypothetical protein